MASRGKACRCRLHAHRGIALAAEHRLVEGEMPDLAFGQSVSRDARDGHLRAVLAAPLVFPMGCCPPKVRFAVDSPLEGDGFELPVPGALGEAARARQGGDHGSSVLVRLSPVRLSGNCLCWHQTRKT